MDRPEALYAWADDVALAYEILGEGPPDVLYLQGFISHVDLNWESPYLARFLRGLAAHGRVIVTDRRGWGCSDRFSPSDVPPLETLAGDLATVMDAAGSERAVLVASNECAMIASLFAASAPDRLLGLVLCDPFPTYAATDETPWMISAAGWREQALRTHADWGTPRWFATATGLKDERERDWLVRYQRAGSAPGAVVAEVERFLSTDPRGVYPSIHVPTLVLASKDGGWDSSPLTAEYLVDRIPRARMVLHDPGETYWLHWYDRGPAIVDEIGRFVAEVREEEAALDRVLATVLFTDIVDSTSRAAAMGDAAWRSLVERHHAAVRSLLARYRGVEVDTAGDGFFATFDGPARALTCARAIVAAVRPLGLEVRAGVHTGECELIAGKVGGLAVSIGARVGALAAPSEVLASQTVKDLVAGSGLRFEGRGSHALKGVPGEWRLYAVTG
jgi:class 3 adenylate cyclase